ncbi:MAG: hypothetical protein ACI8XW_003091 [Gammaproteobacteria bacterium]|jgi:hypothetical protein
MDGPAGAPVVRVLRGLIWGGFVCLLGWPGVGVVLVGMKIPAHSGPRRSARCGPG